MNQTENRRDFFRVQDIIALRYELLTPDSTASAAALVSGNFRILCELQRLSLESRPLLRQITDQERNVAEYLRLIDEKIDLLAQAVVQETEELESMSRIEVNLSEGGIEFLDGQKLPLGQPLLLRMLLLPGHTALALHGRIVHSEATTEPDRFSTGVEFINMEDADRQILARHALHLQSEQRRKQESGVLLAK